jgi:hypothetical protein
MHGQNIKNIWGNFRKYKKYKLAGGLYCRCHPIRSRNVVTGCAAGNIGRIGRVTRPWGAHFYEQSPSVLRLLPSMIKGVLATLSKFSDFADLPSR